MHSSIIVVALVAVGVVSASPQCPHSLPDHYELPEGEWRPARPGEVRSPCPMLNVLANHGYLPRDGKNIDRNITRAAMKDGLNLDSDFADIMFDPALTTNPQPNATWFNLDHLKRHNILEHDGSLSRADAYWNPTQDFNRTVYAEYLSYFKRSDTITLKSAAAARLGRMTTSKRTNPTFNITDNSNSISFGETAAYILALGDRVAGTVPLDRVRMMFEHEKLPRELGWSTGTVPVTADDLFNLTERVMENTKYKGLKGRMYGGIHAGIMARRSP